MRRRRAVGVSGGARLRTGGARSAAWAVRAMLAHHALIARRAQCCVGRAGDACAPRPHCPPRAVLCGLRGRCLRTTPSSPAKPIGKPSLASSPEVATKSSVASKYVTSIAASVGPYRLMSGSGRPMAWVSFCRCESCEHADLAFRSRSDLDLMGSGLAGRA
eukprot:4923200-Prymnesium_polylepis.1